MRHKKTEICQTCAKIKNVCQTCILDLQYHLPVQVRDQGLNVAANLPKDRVNKDYFIKNAEKKLENGEVVYDFEQASLAGKSLLKKMARAEPFYQRNRPHICSFFIKGTCTRGDACPYRHEIPKDNDLGKQDIRSRYLGEDDPVAKKLLARASNTSTLAIPTDKSITSLFLTGVQPEITEFDIKKHFETYGSIKSVIIVAKAKCAFVNFTDREGAEKAAKNSLNVEIKSHPVQVAWAKPKPKGPQTEIKEKDNSETTSSSLLPPPPGSSDMVYPSQDPTMLGSYHTK
ncbi:hypothetical protein K502DRAFT_325965 [Neoconidiobolus thromboides FSU 785]|nr:hypothetical protein K502DRAFT_325965 [Neoconidiobolus thromboides FSU 785]